MNVFVLCAGRTASTTFAKASSHIDGFTSGHETRVDRFFEDRLAYPDNHIEVDNRLAFFLGALDKKYGDDAYYVHLRRNAESVAKSYKARWYHRGSVVRAFYLNIMQAESYQHDRFMDACRFYVKTNESNIQHFLKDKSHVFEFDVDQAQNHFEEFTRWLGKECPRAGLDVWKNVTNPNKKPKRPRVARNLQKVYRTLRAIPTIFHDV